MGFSDGKGAWLRLAWLCENEPTQPPVPRLKTVNKQQWDLLLLSWRWRAGAGEEGMCKCASENGGEDLFKISAANVVGGQQQRGGSSQRASARKLVCGGPGGHWWAREREWAPLCRNQESPTKRPCKHCDRPK
jgi:hypothetical protein